MFAVAYVHEINVNTIPNKVCRIRSSFKLKTKMRPPHSVYRTVVYVVIVPAVIVLHTYDGVEAAGKERLQGSETIDTSSVESDVSSTYDSDSSEPKNDLKKQHKDFKKERKVTEVSGRKTNDYEKYKQKLNDVPFHRRYNEGYGKTRDGYRPRMFNLKERHGGTYYPTTFNSMDAIEKTLLNIKYRRLNDVNKLLLVYERVLRKRPSRFLNMKERYPFISIEGAEGSDSARCAKQFAMQTGGMFLYNPPLVLEELKYRFLNHTAVLKRCFFSLSNYVVASEVAEIISKQPVFISRYYYDNMAYFIAHRLRASRQPIPAENDPVYKWPHDLLQPDLLFYLHTDEETRKKRLFFKASVIQGDFANSLLEVVKRTKDPKVIVLNGGNEVNVIFSNVLKHMKVVGINVTII